MRLPKTESSGRAGSRASTKLSKPTTDDKAIAQAKFPFLSANTYRINGQRAINFNVFKQQDANIVVVGEAVKKALDELRKNLPPDVELKLIRADKMNALDAEMWSGLAEAIDTQRTDALPAHAAATGLPGADAFRRLGGFSPEPVEVRIGEASRICPRALP